MRIEQVEDLADPRVADFRDVRDRDLRDAELFLVEGRLGVERLVGDSCFRTRSVFVSPTVRAALDAALSALPAETPVYVAPRAVLDAVVGDPLHRGCLAAAERGAPVDCQELLAACRPRRALVLEEVTDPDNVGAIFRNARVLGADAILLTPGCADPLYRKAVRVSMASTLQVPFARVDSCPAAFAALRAEGLEIVALHPGPDAAPLDAVAASLDAAVRIALAVGTEGVGLSSAALPGVDHRARIPMAPGVDSLNVATAVGIALHGLASSGGSGTEWPDTR